MSRSIIALAFLSTLSFACSGTDSSSTTSDSGTGSSNHTPGSTNGNDAGSSTGAGDAGGGGGSGDDSSTTTPEDSSVPLSDGATGGSDSSTTAACTGANKICLNLSVPASVDASKVVKLYIGFSQTKGGIPEIGKGTTLQPFTALPGHVMPLTIDNKGLSGSYFINVGLYMQGGGSAAPKAGVDYSASTSQAIPIASSPVAVGETLVLALAQ